MCDPDGRRGKEQERGFSVTPSGMGKSQCARQSK